MTAFRATYSDWKLIKTRGVVQVVMEIPLADADAAYDVLGGMPVHGKERWFGIAALKSPAEEARAKLRQDVPQDSHPDGAKRKMDWRDMQPAAQAGIRCDEPAFASFLREQYTRDWSEGGLDAAECVRLICHVTSRSELGTNQKARIIWKQLDDHYQAWKALEHA